MRHRIRGAAVVVHDDRLLLALHGDAAHGLMYWSPPGGGVEGREDLFACAVRETEEETSLRVVAERPLYLQELVNHRRKTRTLELFVLCRLADGVHPGELRAANEITESRLVSQAEAVQLNVLPGIFAGAFWDDLSAGFPTFRHLGLKVIGEGGEST